MCNLVDIESKETPSRVHIDVILLYLSSGAGPSPISLHEQNGTCPRLGARFCQSAMQQGTSWWEAWRLARTRLPKKLL